MKKNLFFYLFFITQGLVFSQNIAPNPDFEGYGGCPKWYSTSIYSGFEFVNNWYLPTNGTSDYFNRCNNFVFYNLEYGKVGVPYNFFGHQEAASGNGYAGGIFLESFSNGDGTYGDSPYREYLQAKLLDSMVSGKNYCISIKINLADISWVAIDKIGIYFSEERVLDYDNPHPGMRLDLVPQVEFSGSILGDSVNWTTLLC